MDESTKKIVKSYGIRLAILAGIGTAACWGYSRYTTTQKRNEERLTAVEQCSATLSDRLGNVETKVPLLDTKLTTLEARQSAQVKALTDQYAELSTKHQKWEQEQQASQQALCQEIMNVSNDVRHVAQETSARLLHLEEKLGYTKTDIDLLKAKVSPLSTMQIRLTSLEKNVTEINTVLKELQETEEETPVGKCIMSNIGYQIGDEVQYVSFVIKSVTPDVLNKVESVAMSYSAGLQPKQKKVLKETNDGTVQRTEILYTGTIDGKYLRNLLIVDYNRATKSASVFLKLQGNSEVDALATLSRTIPLVASAKEKQSVLESQLVRQ